MLSAASVLRMQRPDTTAWLAEVRSAIVKELSTSLQGYASVELLRVRMTIPAGTHERGSPVAGLVASVVLVLLACCKADDCGRVTVASDGSPTTPACSCTPADLACKKLCKMGAAPQGVAPPPSPPFKPAKGLLDDPTRTPEPLKAGVARLAVIINGRHGCVVAADRAIPLLVHEDGIAEVGPEFNTEGGLSWSGSRGLCNAKLPPIGSEIEWVNPFDPESQLVGITQRDGLSVPSSAPIAIGSSCWIAAKEGFQRVEFGTRPPQVTDVLPTASSGTVMAFDGHRTLVALPERLPGVAMIITVDEQGVARDRVEAMVDAPQPEQPKEAVIAGDNLVILSGRESPPRDGGYSPFTQRLSLWRLMSRGVQLLSSQVHENLALPYKHWPWRSLSALGDHLFFCAGARYLIALPLPFRDDSEPVLAHADPGRCLGVRAVGGLLYVIGSEGHDSLEQLVLLRGSVAGGVFRVIHRYPVPHDAQDLR